MAPETSARITEEDVKRIAKLAHLELRDDEVATMVRDLGQILGYVDQLQEVDVSDVEATLHGDNAGIVPRPDVVVPSLPHEVALAEAPSVDEGGFRVPAYVDEG